AHDAPVSRRLIPPDGRALQPRKPQRPAGEREQDQDNPVPVRGADDLADRDRAGGRLVLVERGELPAASELIRRGIGENGRGPGARGHRQLLVTKRRKVDRDVVWPAWQGGDRAIGLWSARTSLPICRPGNHPGTA